MLYILKGHKKEERANKQKILTSILMVCVLLSSVALVRAEIVYPNYIAINYFTCALNVSSGKADCIVSVSPQKPTYSVFISASLKKSSNGQNWQTVKSWAVSSADFDESVSIETGYKYKLFATATIKNASGNVIETASKSSAIKEY